MSIVDRIDKVSRILESLESPEFSFLGQSFQDWIPVALFIFVLLLFAWWLWEEYKDKTYLSDKYGSFR